MARIVTVYRGSQKKFELVEMSSIRWLKISEALARLGHRVDIATNEPGFLRGRFPAAMGRNLRRVPLSKVRWRDYDVVKTLFHAGFETLEKYGGAGHPFIISKLGSVVDSSDRPEIYFYGDFRRRLYAVQERIHAASRYVTVLTRESEELWRSRFGGENVLLVPGAADAGIPPPGRDPFPAGKGPRCLFAANLYYRADQREANENMTGKLNRLGALLAPRGLSLYVIGTGDTGGLDSRVVRHLGAVSYEKSWDYLRHAQAGIVLALGPHANHNESTKIYHYLRAGLPVVCESGFPNQGLVNEARLGFVTGNGDMEEMARKIEEAVAARWDRERAIQMILAGHTWDVRAAQYDRILREDFSRKADPR